MSPFNSYFAVKEPFRIWRHVGHSQSNTYIGSSRVFNTVKNAEVAKPGDELHCLVGGTFLVRGGVAHEISLKPPVHIFEAKYHNTPAERIAEDLEKGGRLSKLQSATKVDYAAARKALAANRLPDLHAETVHVEDSPEMTTLRKASRGLVDRLADAGLDAEARYRDVDCYKGARLELRIDDAEVSVMGLGGVSASSYAVVVPDAFAENPTEQGFARDVVKGGPDVADRIAALLDSVVERAIAKGAAPRP